MTDNVVKFTIDGYTFAKSIGEATKLVRDLEHKIRIARMYGSRLPYENGRLQLWDIEAILTPFMKEHAVSTIAYSDVERSALVGAIWQRICRDKSDTAMYCPCSGCNGVPQGYHSQSEKSQWQIDICDLRNYLAYLLTDNHLQDHGAVRECCLHLLERLGEILATARP